MKTYNFYDTSSLLLRAQNLFESEENIVISSITLNELENIKTSMNKDADVKFAARHILHLLEEHPEAYEVHIFNHSMLNPIAEKNLSINEDTKILATAIDYDINKHPDETVFITNDLALSHIANLFFGADSVQKIVENNETYDGFLTVSLSNEEMANFYSNQQQNLYDLYINQYLIIQNLNNEIVDTLCWTGGGYRNLNYKTFNSNYFGNVKPYKDDIYQAIFADSLINNKITLVKGKAGSGKTFLSLAYLLCQLEKNKIDKIIIFCNTIATKGSAKLGLILE